MIPDLNDDLDGPPNVNEALVTNAYFDFIPEEVSVTVNAQDVMVVEAVASLFDLSEADDIDVDHQSLSSNSSHMSDSDHPFPELDLMLALQHWNIEVTILGTPCLVYYQSSKMRDTKNFPKTGVLC